MEVKIVVGAGHKRQSVDYDVNRFPVLRRLDAPVQLRQASGRNNVALNREAKGSEQGILLLLEKTVTMTPKIPPVISANPKTPPNDVGCATIHRCTGLRAVLVVVVDGAQVKRCAPYLATGLMGDPKVSPKTS